MPIKPRVAVEATATTPAVTAVPANVAIHCRRIRRAMTFPKAAASLNIPAQILPLDPTDANSIGVAVQNLNQHAKLARAKNAKPKSNYRRSASRQKVSKK